MQYKILTASNAEQLALAVNASIKDGWVPVGGVACMREPHYGDPSYYQAMIKGKPNESK